MKPSFLKQTAHFLQYMPIAGMLALGRLLDFDRRGRIAGAIVGFGTRWLPPFHKRIDQNLALIFPEMPAAERNRIAAEVGRNTGRTLSEILHNDEFAQKLDRFHASGPGLATLEVARDTGKGAIIVSAHFGQWEAIRHVLKSKGMETGAMYRRNNNLWYEKHFLSGIKQGGAPIVAKGRSGNMNMIRHIRKGGFFAILPDQYVHAGPLMPLLGHDTKTTLAPAELALKYGLPLVPAFGERDTNGEDILVDFEVEIPHTNAHEMMQEFNTRLGKRITANPGQWYWLHRRWRVGLPR